MPEPIQQDLFPEDLLEVQAKADYLLGLMYHKQAVKDHYSSNTVVEQVDL